jgi:AcrR family transcriptional regulator
MFVDTRITHIVMSREVENLLLPEPRVAPLQARARERYDAILTAARAEIGEKGLDALTMYSIARRAGITPTSIYRYFESVEQILIAVTSLIFEDLEAQIAQLAESSHSADELVEAFEKGIRESWKAFSRNRVAQGLWAASIYLPQLRTIEESLNQRIVSLMCRRFDDLVPNSDISAVRRLLTLLVGLSTPTFALAARQPRGAQSALIDEFIAMAAARLKQVVGGVSDDD